MSFKKFIFNNFRLNYYDFIFLFFLILPVTTQFAERSMIWSAFFFWSVSSHPCWISVYSLHSYPLFIPSYFSLSPFQSPLFPVFSDIGPSVKLFNVLSFSLWHSVYLFFLFALYFICLPHISISSVASSLFFSRLVLANFLFHSFLFPMSICILLRLQCAFAAALRICVCIQR